MGLFSKQVTTVKFNGNGTATETKNGKSREVMAADFNKTKRNKGK